jgi:hypothetical protein
MNGRKEPLEELTGLMPVVQRIGGLGNEGG